MANLIGKTADETAENVMTYAAANGLIVTHDQTINDCLTRNVRYMTLVSEAKTLKLIIVPDGRMSREILDNSIPWNGIQQ